MNIVLGDFSKVISTGSHSFTNISSVITFTEEETVRSADLLPSRDEVDFSDFQNYREIIDHYLPKLYKKEVGKVCAKIKKALSLDWEGLEIEGTSIYFKDGSFSVSYVEIDSKKGIIEKQISFDREWFKSPGTILVALETLNFNYSKISLYLNKEVNLLTFAKSLEENNWDIELFSEDAIEATLGQYRAAIQATQIDFFGFHPSEIIGIGAVGEDHAIVSTVYSLLT